MLLLDQEPGTGRRSVRGPGDFADSPLVRRRSTVCSMSSVIAGGRLPDGPSRRGGETVLDSDPPQRLVVTWRSRYEPALAAEQPSRVSGEIEPQDGGFYKLTVVHDQLDGTPKTAANVAGLGWMTIFSDLKTLLETGAPLKDT